MNIISSEDDANELLYAMIRGSAWDYFLKGAIKPEVIRIRKALITNDTLSMQEHFAYVRTLAFLKKMLVDLYKQFNTDVPKQYLAWFE